MSTNTPNCVSFTTEVKQHARNILNLARWFPESIYANTLTLNQALELVAQSNGCKSYSALQAKEKSEPDFVWKAITTALFPKLDVHSTSFLIDQLFLKTIYSYLTATASDFNDFEIQYDCSSLLIYVSRWVLTKNYSPENLFINLALVNYVGLRLIRDYHLLSKDDQDLFERLTASSKYFLTSQYIRMNRITNHANDEIDSDWEFNKGGKWSELTLTEIDCSIVLDADLMNEAYQLEFSTLKQILDAKNIDSVILNSDVLAELWRLTQGIEPIAESPSNYDHYDPDFAEGLFLTPMIEGGIRTVSIENFSLEWIIQYQDQSGRTMMDRINCDGWLDVYYNGAYVVRAGLPEKMIGMDNLATQLFTAQIKTIKNTLMKHQYVLANLYGEVFYQDNSQVSVIDRYTKLLNKVDYSLSVEYGSKSLISVEMMKHHGYEFPNNSIPKNTYAILEGKEVVSSFDKVEDLLIMDLQREFASLRV